MLRRLKRIRLKTKISLISGEFMCCGAMCDKRRAQERIDRMQKVINRVHRYLNDDITTVQEFEDMLTELDKLKVELDNDK